MWTKTTRWVQASRGIVRYGRFDVNPEVRLRHLGDERMRSLLGLLLLVIAGASPAAQRLATESFDITIQTRCPEGVVGCDDVLYVGVHRKSGRSIRLVGRELHTRCADGVTPCRFLGYAFDNGSTRYLVSDEGRLIVRQGDRVLVEERGEWQ